jgi:hypothetical protein
MVFSQKVNWFILYQSADKMASIFLGLREIGNRAGIVMKGSPFRRPLNALCGVGVYRNMDSLLRGNDKKRDLFDSLHSVQNDVFWGEVKYGAGSVDIDIAFIYHL